MNRVPAVSSWKQHYFIVLTPFFSRLGEPSDGAGGCLDSFRRTPPQVTDTHHPKEMNIPP